LKGSKFHLTLNNQVVLCDGSTVWTVINESKEVQINDYAKDENAITPTNILTIWEKNFRYKLINEETIDGILCQVIDLIPNEGNKPYYKVRIYIDKAKQQVYKASVFQREGDTHTYIIKKLVTSEQIADTYFTFNKKDFPGYSVTDLR